MKKYPWNAANKFDEVIIDFITGIKKMQKIKMVEEQKTLLVALHKNYASVRELTKFKKVSG